MTYLQTYLVLDIFCDRRELTDGLGDFRDAAHFVESLSADAQ